MTLIRQIATMTFVLGIALPAVAQVACDQCDAGNMCAESTLRDWTCHAVRSTQWIEVSVWDAECEPVCLAGCAGIHGPCGNACGSVACDSPDDCHGKPRFGLSGLFAHITRPNRVRTRNKLMRRTQRVMVPAIEYVFVPIYPMDSCFDSKGHVDVDGVSQMAESFQTASSETPHAMTTLAVQPLPPIIPRDQLDSWAEVNTTEPVVRYLSSETPVPATLDANDVPTSIQSSEPPSPSTARRSPKIYLVQ